MASRPKLRSAFTKARVIGPLYTSGPVAVSPDGLAIVTCVADELLCTNIETGLQICKFATDGQPITSACISPTGKHIAVYTSSMALRIYELPSFTSSIALLQPIRVVARAHDAPVHVCKIDPTSTYLASGSADGTVKVWDIVRGFVTHIFKGHGGVVSALTFNFPRDTSSAAQTNTMHLITASVDTKIRIFDLNASTKKGSSSKPEAVLDGHSSVPRGLDVSQDGRWLVSGGRDSVVLVWDLSSLYGAESSKGKRKASAPTIAKTIAVSERVEALGILRPDDRLPGTSSSSNSLQIYTGGERGNVKIWDANEGKMLLTLGQTHAHISDEQEEQRQIVDVLYNTSLSNLVSIHADQNIMFYSLSSHSLVRQLVGFNDEIVDATFLSPSPNQADSHLALATNSSLIRVYTTSGLDARLLEGHTDIVLALDHSPNSTFLASSSKDKTARIWAPVAAGSSWTYINVAVCEGHAESVGAVAFPRQSDESTPLGLPPFIFTGSQDRTIKMWDLSNVDVEAEESVRCKSLTTMKAHDKDINSLDVSPNNRLLVSGSQDRTAKVYQIDYVGGKSPRGELKLLGTCKGHKRGVWSVRFGRNERVLATGSGDKTIKLWNLDDFSCVKTFEGHTNSVLRVDILNMGTQLVSTAADGLVKLWNIHEEECTATMDNHEDKVWALAVSSNEKTIVSSSADSFVTFWEDCTEEQEQEKATKKQELVAREQDFLNYIALNDYKRAIQLALSMEQPGRLLSLFKQIRTADSANSLTGDASVDEVIRTLAGPDLTTLLRFVRDWNSNAKTSAVAQGILLAVVKLRPAQDIADAFAAQAKQTDLSGLGDGEVKPNANALSVKELVDAMIPYTERHRTRLDALLQQSYIVDLILSEMDDGMGGESDAEGLMEVD